MVKYKLVFTTCANTEDANMLAKAVLEKKLAACVNVLPAVTSLYMWQGELMQEQEIKLFIKTRSCKASVLIDTLKHIHPYQVPEIQILDITDGNQDYFSWIDEVLA